jgi:hypothetical protein
MKEEDSKTNPPTGRPIISSRLPKAFSQPKHLTTKKSQDHQDLSLVSEFKKVKKLLSPLKNVSHKSSAFRQVINKLSKFPQFNEGPSSSLPQIDFLTQSVVRLEEMITLSIIKSSCASGTVRKVLHAPTFKIYATKEIPINTVATRKHLVDNLKAWQGVQSSARHLVDVSSSFWNTPEGCVTLVTEFMSGDSLARLCDNIGAIPEKSLKSVARRVLTGLSYFHQKVGPHGAVNLNHILFDRQGKSKLSIGINLKERIQEKTVNDDINAFGSCFIAAALGSLEWLSEIPQNSCCLLHAGLKTGEIPYLARLSGKFQDFLCKASAFECKTTINELLSHSWINESDADGPDISLKDLLSLTVAGSKEVMPDNDRQLEIFMENVLVVLSGRSDMKMATASNVKEVALELGVKPEVLQEKVAAIFKNN